MPFGVEVDRLVLFDKRVTAAIAQRDNPLDLFGGIAIFLHCPHEEHENHEDHDHPTLVYRQLPGVTVTSPQPDVFTIHSEVDGGDTEEFTTLNSAVTFFTNKVGEATTTIPPEVREALRGLAELLHRMMDEEDSDDN